MTATAQLAADIARAQLLAPDDLAFEIGAAEMIGALCGENDEDRAYRAELEKLAAR